MLLPRLLVVETAVLRPVDSELTPLCAVLMPVEVDVDSDTIELFADEMPVDAEVDSDATALLVVLRPVDNEPMPVEVEVDSDKIELFVDEMPVDAEVDSDATALLVVLRPVDSELTPLCAVLIPVEADVDRLLIAVFVANSCEPLIASVLVAVTRPAATLVTWRSAPAAPTLTTLVGFVPA
ncbi:hypothetical protein WJ63_29170 [Burkholderia pyrrocinia]|nr:hypothetical protein WJ63_29170 [Burkholderia pyrrocinia]